MNIFPSFINRDIPSPPLVMDSSRFPQGIDRGRSGESGWMAYIYSLDHDDDDDDDRGRRKDYKDEEEAESDHSMTSDASSGLRYQYGGFGDGRKKNERQNGGKKEQTEKENNIKTVKDRGDSGARSKNI